MRRFQIAVRWAGAAFLLYLVYPETEPWTVVVLSLVFLLSEAAGFLSEAAGFCILAQDREIKDLQRKLPRNAKDLWVLLALALPFVASAAPPLSDSYVLAAVAESRADGIRGPTAGVVAGYARDFGRVDLGVEAGWSRTPKIDAGDGSTLAAEVFIRTRKGPWYGALGATWGATRTARYSKAAWAPRLEVGREVAHGVVLAAHWRLPDSSANRAESIGLVFHLRRGRFLGRFTVEEFRHSQGHGLRLGLALGASLRRREW